MKIFIQLMLIGVVLSLVNCTPVEQRYYPRGCDPVCTGNSIDPDNNTFDYDSDRPNF